MLREILLLLAEDEALMFRKDPNHDVVHLMTEKGPEECECISEDDCFCRSLAAISIPLADLRKLTSDDEIFAIIKETRQNHRDYHREKVYGIKKRHDNTSEDDDI